MDNLTKTVIDYATLKSNIPQLLRQARGARSYAEMAKILGYPHRTYLWKVEHGKLKPTDELIQRLAMFLAK